MWILDIPLRLAFPGLYEKAEKKSCLVHECVEEGEWKMSFRTTLNMVDMQNWENLLQLVANIRLNEAEDTPKWMFEKSNQYSTKSMYRWMTHRGVVNKRIRRVWDSRLPMRIKVFMWLTFNNRLQTGVELKKRKWKGSHLCGICGCPETTDHILFACCVARFVWACFTEALAWDRAPRSLNDFLDTWIPLGCRDYNLKLFLFASVLWGLWTTRNKRAIEGKFPRSPTDVLFKIHAFLQRWRVRLRSEDQDKLANLEGQVRSWTEEFLLQLRGRPPDEDFL